MGTQIENPERRVGLHDLKLLRVLVEEVAVREEDVRHYAWPPAALSCCNGTKSCVRLAAIDVGVANSVAFGLRAPASRSRRLSQDARTEAAATVLPGFHESTSACNASRSAR